MKALSILVAFVAGGVVVACGSIASLQDRPCPCETGFLCCDNVCVAQGTIPSGFGNVSPGSPQTGSCLGLSSFGGNPNPTGTEDAGSSGFGNPGSDGGPNGVGITKGSDAQSADTVGDGGGQEGGFVDPTECELDCAVAAANGCGLDNFTASSECMTLCASSPTASQLACLRASPCATLVKALGGTGTVCGVSADRDGGTMTEADGATDGEASLESGTDAGAVQSTFCTSFTDGDQGVLNYCTGALASGLGAAQELAQSQLDCASMNMGGTVVAACPSANLLGCCSSSDFPELVDVFCYYGVDMNYKVSCVAAGGTWATTLPL